MISFEGLLALANALTMIIFAVVDLALWRIQRREPAGKGVFAVQHSGAAGRRGACRRANPGRGRLPLAQATLRREPLRNRAHFRERTLDPGSSPSASPSATNILRGF